jgi:hypothetical protein
MNTRLLHLVAPVAPAAAGRAYTRHDPGDDIGRAIMATPLGGATVEILVGPRRYHLHNWTIVDSQPPTAGRLSAVWIPRIDLPPLRPPLRWRAQHLLRKWW